jgi:REP element-mobilizing transposase RayT
MNKRFKYKYRIESSRLKNYDYSQEGFYFITINTHQREHYFGEIRDNKMILSEIGNIVKEEWLISEQIRGNIYFDEWIIMPNHIHGIVIIDYSDDNKNRYKLKKSNFTKTPNKIYTDKRLEKYDGVNPDLSKISPIPNSLSTMIRFFKGKVKIRSKNVDLMFDWQPKFNDRIIKDESSLFTVRKYIKDNIKNWNEDQSN